jgi:hypothetical protein
MTLLSPSAPAHHRARIYRPAGLFLLGVLVLFLSGCVMDRPVDLADAKAKVQTLEEALDASRTQLDHITGLLEQAKAVAAQTGSEAAKQVVTQLEHAAAVASASIPQLQEAVGNAKRTVTDLEAGGGSAPLWYVLAGFAVQYVPKLATLIPGVGPAFGPIATLIANGLWSVASTKRQREEEERLAAEAKALPMQVRVTHQALAALPSDRAEGIKDSARREQELAGLYDILRPHVLAVENTPPKA